MPLVAPDGLIVVPVEGGGVTGGGVTGGGVTGGGVTGGYGTRGGSWERKYCKYYIVCHMSLCMGSLRLTTTSRLV